MKVVGLITEYNPFHNGHKFHIDEARRLTGADYVIAVMSGNFVQRGAPALIDKYSRAKMALENGVDLIFELPVCFSTASAEYFAHGAVSVLNKLGVVDYICFGSECGDIKLLTKAAELLTDTKELFDEILQSYLKKGYSYPAARAEAVLETLKVQELPDGEQIGPILNEPNNILGIEYIKALRRFGSTIGPVTIERKSAHYHEKALSVSDDFNPSEDELSLTEKDLNDNITAISSATAIRNALINDPDTDIRIGKIIASVPENVFNILRDSFLKSFPVSEEDFADIIHYRLIYADSDSLSEYFDMSADLAERIKNIGDNSCSIEDFYRKIKSKNLTLTRINRALLHIMLNIKKTDMDMYCKNGYSQYARLLGFKKDASVLLRKIEKAGEIPVITKLSRADRQLTPAAMKMLTEDINASHLYNRIVYSKYKAEILNEYKHGICII